MVTFHGAREAKAYFVLLFVRLGGTAVFGFAGAISALSPRLRPMSNVVALASFAVVLAVSIASIVAGVLRKYESTTLSERLGFYISLQGLDEAASLAGVEPSRARRWVRSSIVLAVLGIAVGAVSAIFAKY